MKYGLLPLLACHALAALVAAEPIVIPLTQHTVNLGTDDAPARKSYFVGKLRVGGEEAQEMRVHFETGSGSVLLDSTRCQSPACLQHRQYAPGAAGAVDVDEHGSPASPVRPRPHVAIGIDDHDTDDRGGKAIGDLLRDKICVGDAPGMACFDMGLVAATNMTDRPFALMPFDGLVGLGLDGVSVAPAFNFLGRMAAASGLPDRFALYVPPSRQPGAPAAELSLGGHRESRLALPLAWAAAWQPGSGFWQIHIQAIRVGGRDLGLCDDGGCVGLLDSASSHIGVPSEWLPDLTKQLAVAPGCGAHDGPALEFILDGGITLTLTPLEYAGPESNTPCAPQLHPFLADERASAGKRVVNSKVLRAGVDLRTLILGEPLLRRYYTVFDAGAQRLGFGLSAAAAAAAAPERDEVIVLQQSALLRENAGSRGSGRGMEL